MPLYLARGARRTAPYSRHRLPYLLPSLFLHVSPSNGANYTNFENLIDKKHHVDKFKKNTLSIANPSFAFLRLRRKKARMGKNYVTYFFGFSTIKLTK